MAASLSTLELTFRLAVAVFVVAAPSALFVGFYRLLVRMRDDDLVTRVLAHVDETGHRKQSPAAVLTGGALDAGPGSATVACDACGSPNPPFADYCGACLSSLDG
jgi:hypothetical protein